MIKLIVNYTGIKRSLGNPTSEHGCILEFDKLEDVSDQAIIEKLKKKYSNVGINGFNVWSNGRKQSSSTNQFFRTNTGSYI